MKKKMFSKFSNILHHAVEALAPQLSLKEEFVYHWKAVTTFFMDNKGEKMPIDQTQIPEHLDQMVVLLTEEEKIEQLDSTGPCMEYLLQHKLLETLYSLGRTDHPPGMKQIVLQFFTKLLSRLKQPILAHVSVHRAVHRLVKACGEVQAAPTESEEIQFLCTVCSVVKSTPYLVNFFIEVPKLKTDARKTSLTKDVPTLENEGQLKTANSSSNANTLPNANSTNGPSSDGRSFSLMNSLLNLSHSADSRVAVKACEGLMLCASLPEETAATCIVHDTAFCMEMSQRLVEAYLKLPSFISPLDLENVEAKWGLDVITESEDHKTFLGKRHLVSFLSWLDYCDQLISVSNPMVAKNLAKSIRELFLNVIMEPSVLQTSEPGAILATAYLNRCLRTVCSPELLSEFCFFILGSERLPEQKEETTHPGIRDRLIERCNHLSEELSLITLKLFDTLLQKDDEHIIHNLVLRNLLGRNYYKTSPEINEQDKGENSPTTNGISENGEEDTCTEASAKPNLSRSSSRTEVHKIVNCFLSLLPEQLKSSYQTADSGYDMYLRDAHKQFHHVCEMTDPWSWPKEPVVIRRFVMDDFYEGSFLRMILDKMSHLMDQSYPVNLQLTSVISRLALLPHPNLSEFLLDPFLPVRDGVKTLFSVFQKLSSEIRTKLHTQSDLSQKLVSVRRQLMGTSPNLHRYEDQNQLEAIIVMEEFCKELSAIAFVKHHTEVNKSC
ncbi:FHF complex subunit HOOK interacting protein 2A-like isoform X2 [Saccostrea echinata]|uniref:FHF complex subunit HOOK interacting protein 2A-like isoform X2 n=1 Tax=Saccostrea echinata TaxID=191078 RepID=UPI002A7F98B4|nr:FHF complex subunit HOOK interacting protein 2A-like isoform X2 [Saccostrea echinata]